MASIFGAIPGGLLLFRAYNRIMLTLWPRRIVRTYFGASMACDGRDLIQNRILRFGVWEPEVSAQFEASIRAGDLVVDIGANVGFFTLLAANLTGPTGSVIAIEASPRIAALLQDNLDRNKPLPVSLRIVAVSDRPGQVMIYDGPDGNIGRTRTMDGLGFTPGGTVTALPIDQILSAEEIRTAAFIKLDVEGAERPVLEHILAHLDRFASLRHVLVETSVENDPDAWQAIFQRFSDAGFRAGAIENRYDYAWYLRWKQPKGLVPLSRLPDAQADVLFSREINAG